MSDAFMPPYSLDWILIFGPRHLERVMLEWIEHYNAARPHRSLDLGTPIA
ncbi:MAG TPA: integrase core domain-containing protein [Candidatus Dormibacteraeota bacterium]|nr:integrase core domain-containing protein [Candidatus Dormibacteraeota bacterium]